MQQHESSEVKYVGGARAFSKQLTMGSPPPYFDFQKVFFLYTLGLQQRTIRMKNIFFEFGLLLKELLLTQYIHLVL